MKKVVSVWLLLMVAGIFTSGCVYVSFQQTQRNDADIPAVMAAKQTIFELQSGKAPQEALPIITNISSTITPFVLIYDNNKKLIATSAVGSQFSYPQGCLSQVEQSGINRVTWQPQKGLRFATVGIKFNNGYVVGGYSLSESESRTERFAETLFVGSILYALGCAALLSLYHQVAKRQLAK